MKDMPQLTEKDIQSVLDEKVRPILKSHNGGIDLIGIEGNVVRLRLAGACAACMGAEQTIRDVIVAAVREAFPSVSDVRVETGVSDEMVAEALRFLKRAK